LKKSTESFVMEAEQHHLCTVTLQTSLSSAGTTFRS